MILRLFEHAAKFDCEGTHEYFDMHCDDYQLTDGVLWVMRFKAQDVFIPLSSIKMFVKLPPEIVVESKQLTDSDLQDEAIV